MVEKFKVFGSKEVIEESKDFSRKSRMNLDGGGWLVMRSGVRRWEGVKVRGMGRVEVGKRCWDGRWKAATVDKLTCVRERCALTEQ
jgi:hypothetical protein